MAEIPERDAALLLDMVLAARDAQGFVAGLDKAAFLTSRLHQNAVIRSLEVIGEAANTLTPECRAALPDIPWRDIIGLRHRLIHGYAEVRLDRVWTSCRPTSPPSSPRSNPSSHPTSRQRDEHRTPA